MKFDEISANENCSTCHSSFVHTVLSNFVMCEQYCRNTCNPFFIGINFGLNLVTCEPGLTCLSLSGIPISQQHLIWQSMELEDDYCLHDYSIQDGATLKLVLAMRGGPINTRRG